MRIVHLSDTHIGKRRYNLNSSPRDFYEAFREAFEIALSYDPDVVIHSGDLFDNPYPLNFTKRRIIEDLVNFSRKAPILMVAGNHDYADVDGLSPVGFIGIVAGNIFNAEYRDVLSHERPRPVQVDMDGARFFLIPFVRDRQTLREVVNAALEDLSDGLNFVVLHQIIDGFTAKKKNMTLDIPHEELKGFHFRFVGHFHTPHLDRDGGFVYAGSTEALSFDEYEYDESGVVKPSTRKRVFVFDFESSGNYRVEEVVLRSPRPFLMYRMDYPSLEELEERLSEIPVEHDKKPILILKLRARNVREMEEYSHVINTFRSRGYYEHIRADIVPDEVAVEVEETGMEGIKREILGEFYDMVVEAEGMVESMEDSGMRNLREKLMEFLEARYEDREDSSG